MRFISFLFTVWVSYIFLRLIIMPFFLYLWARYIRTKRTTGASAEFVHKQAPQRSYTENIVDAEFEELN
ncbi:MAG: hypothetical protein JSW17_04130 [Candidatus Omnitrophota bacterium]|nr:MAG: hypothetical protein JSW17_04130 [Candidatus Omnitrophota bacterium]